MKKLLSAAGLIAFLVASLPVFAQTRYIYTLAGNGTSGFSGDGGPAENAMISSPTDVATDINNNVYIVDQGNKRIRRISAIGHVITTIAGTGATGSSGDGGPATAATFNTPNGIAIDGLGSIYIADQGNNKIRKIGTDGIISTIAGTGTSGFSGDGGAAISAQFAAPTSVAVDNTGCLYIGDNGNHRIRKIDAAGIITTIAGGGSTSFSVDGVAATSVSLCTIHHLTVDGTGNVYFTNQGCMEVLKLTTSGQLYLAQHLLTPWGVTNDLTGNLFIANHGNQIIKKDMTSGTIDTVVRSSSGSIIGDGGPAISGSINSANGICYSLLGELFVADQGHDRIRIITPYMYATYSADSFGISVNEYCSGPEVNILTSRYATTLNQTTFFGDGTSYSSAINPAYGSYPGYATFSHTYALPGMYTMKTILRDGASVVDSLIYSYQYKLCNTMQMRFYLDANSSLNYEPTTDPLSAYPIKTRVDSNGVPVDTITATSGFYYTAYGTPGDVYTFTVISLPSGLISSAPTSGSVSDTIQTGVYNFGINNVGLICSGIPGKDLRVHSANRCGSHRYGGELIIDNLYCSVSTSPATLTLSISPKYAYHSASPAPIAVSGNTLTWNFSDFSLSAGPVHVSIWGERPSGTSAYTPGDTVHSYAIIGPNTGDSDTSDNVSNPVDTVKSGYDPNLIAVTPEAYNPSGTQLQYTIGFENTGNDTAFNIYILDTLSDDLDPSTIEVVTASSAMDIFTFSAGGHTIIKFDFPHINLLDSSHHNQCDGMVIYKIKSRNGLPDCTHIPNRAGIYFDENPVVMTNTIENIVGPAPTASGIAGSNTVCPGSSVTLIASVSGGTWSTSNGNATVLDGVVSGVTNGSVFIYYSVPAACGPVISQFLMSIGAPLPGYISAPPAICVGATVSISSSEPGGIWSSYNSNTSLSGSSLSGVSAGVDTLYYTITSACGSVVTSQLIQIDTIVLPDAISGISKICEGTTVTLTDITPGGSWSFNNANASITSSGALTGLISGTGIAYYTITNACGSNIASFPVTIQSAADCGNTNVGANSGSNDLQIFPNPASNNLTIMMTDNLFQAVSVINQVGQVVALHTLTAGISNIDVSCLPDGTYFLAFKGASGTRTLRFVKQ